MGLHALLIFSAMVLLVPDGAARSAIQGKIREIARRVPASLVDGAKFGWAVSLSGDTAVISSLSDDGQALNSGSVYVYARSQGPASGSGGPRNWNPVRRVVASDGAAADQFGYSLSLSGSTLAVGSRYDDDNGQDSGSVYLYRRNLGGADHWGEWRKLHPSDPAAGDNFAWSVAVDGDTLAVGSVFGSDGTGAAYVFSRHQGGTDRWGEVKKLTSANAEEGDRFGRWVAIDGTRLVVTADGEDDAGSSSGAAYLYERDRGGPGNWGLVKRFTAVDAAPVDHFGISADVSGDTVVIGAHRDDDLGQESGSAYVYERNEGGAGNWGQSAKLLASDGASADSFGRTLAIDRDRILVGSYQHGHGLLQAGASYVFGRDSGGVGTWGEERELLASDRGELDVYGWIVALSNEDLLVGAPQISAPGGVPGVGYFLRSTRTLAGSGVSGSGIGAWIARRIMSFRLPGLSAWDGLR